MDGYPKSFFVERGVRQGCPLSALLFILIVEVLACKIRQNKDITGISVSQGNHPNTLIKVSQYADDTTLFVNSTEYVNKAMKEINDFGSLAGPNVNWIKTQFMKLNSIRELTNDSNIEYTQEPVKCLGIYVGENNKELDTLIWNDKIDKIANILNLWKMRNLTYYGKVVIVKILAVSQIVYRATALSIPTCVIKRLNRLGMIDLECKVRSLKLSWIYKFLNGPESHWKSLLTYWLRKIGGIQTCFKYNCCPKDMNNLCKKNNLPNFYVELFNIWSGLKYMNVHRVKDIANEINWNNSNIKFQN